MATTAEQVETGHDVDDARLQQERSTNKHVVSDAQDAAIPPRDYQGPGPGHEEHRKRQDGLAKPEQSSATTTGANGVGDRDIEKEAAAIADTAKEAAGETDPNVVGWDDNDPDHPFNWPRWRTLTNLVLISFMTFLTPLASCTSICLKSAALVLM